jgi:hypothetical protein
MQNISTRWRKCLAGPATGRFNRIAAHADRRGEVRARQSSIAARTRSVTSAAVAFQSNGNRFRPVVHRGRPQAGATAWQWLSPAPRLRRSRWDVNFQLEAAHNLAVRCYALNVENHDLFLSRHDFAFQPLQPASEILGDHAMHRWPEVFCYFDLFRRPDLLERRLGQLQSAR